MKNYKNCPPTRKHPAALRRTAAPGATQSARKQVSADFCEKLDERYFKKMSARLAKIETIKNSPEYRAEIEKSMRLFASYSAKSLNNVAAASFKITKTKKRSDLSRRFPPKKGLCEGLPTYYLFEFASGYALFYAHGEENLCISNFKSHFKYISNFESPEKDINDIFTLKAFHPFSSTADALVQMNAISNSTVTPQLKDFLVYNLPKRVGGKSSCCVVTDDPLLGDNILTTTGMAVKGGIFHIDVMRCLRAKIDKFFDGLEPKDLGKQQLNLARLYSKQRCTTAVIKGSEAISSSSLQQLYVVPHRGGQRSTVDSSKVIAPSSMKKFVVVPHRFEGVFIAKGKEDFICTKNLVPGQALYGEELIYTQNEDGTEVEFRVWNPLRSKLAAAILCGLKKLCVKPGSRVLYLGDACEVTVSHLSDLVGSDGLVYVVGLSDVVVNMVDKRPNVITIFEEPDFRRKYRMVVSMVDVIFADIVYPQQVDWMVGNAAFYLRAGGHYMISTRANNIDLTGQGKDLFANYHGYGWREFNPIEVVMLEPIMREYVMAVGGIRVPEE